MGSLIPSEVKARMAHPTEHDSNAIGIDGSIPLPPRRRWLRRITLALLVLVMLAAGVRVWWGYYADRRVAAFLAQAKAHGEPSSPADLQPPPIPNEENGTVLIAEASDQFRLNDEEFDFLEHNGHWPSASSPERVVWNKVLADVASSLDLVRLSRSRPSLYPVHRIDQSVEREARRDAILADILARLASHEWSSGNFEDSLDHLLDIVQIARAMRSDAQLHDMFWESLTVDASCLFVIEDFAQPTKLQLESIARNRDRYCARMRSLLAILFDEGELRHAFATTCYSEGLRDVRKARFNSNSIDGQWLLGCLLEPSVRIEAVRSARRHFALARLASQPDISFDSGLAMLPPRDERQGPNLRSWLVNNSRLGPWPEGMLDTYCRFLGYYRTIWIVMAIHLYAVDHKGMLPTKLDELLPNDLPLIPHCPIGMVNQPFIYELNGKNRAKVYSPACRILVGDWNS